MKFDKTKVKFYVPAPDKGWSEENSVIVTLWILMFILFNIFYHFLTFL